MTITPTGIVYIVWGIVSVSLITWGVVEARKPEPPGHFFSFQPVIGIIIAAGGVIMAFLGILGYLF